MFRDNSLEKLLKLTKTFSLKNLVLFDKHGKLRRYDDEIDILEEFFEERIKIYGQRKKY